MGPLLRNGQNMQKFLAVLAVLALAEGMSVRDQWTSFKASHGKKYSVKENTLRFNIWNANRKMVEEHNAGDHEWTMAMYEWSDWTQEEFAERMLGYQAPENLDSSTTVSSLSDMTMAPTGSSRTPGVAAGERVATSG